MFASKGEYMNKSIECSSGKKDEPRIECRCGSTEHAPAQPLKDFHWISGSVKTQSGDIPKVRTSLNARDRFGSIKARWGIRRMNYSVPPGLYAAGDPSPESPVLVSANYKMSFDHLRKNLEGRSAWILVLDTKGINVWCAAGKGTFGTGELLRRIKITEIDKIVNHRKLIVPQLGATGVSAYRVQKSSGFRVIYGPVRAEDISKFLDAEMKASPEMRRVKFRLLDRIVLVPVELVGGMKYVLLMAAAFALIGGFSSSGYSFANIITTGLSGGLLIFTSFLFGVIFGPVLLPYLPGRAFSIKGAALGATAVATITVIGLPRLGVFGSWPHLAAFMFLIPALISFTLMNFTGASTFTSLSGVLREMKVAVPIQIFSAVIGLGLWISGLFISKG